MIYHNINYISIIIEIFVSYIIDIHLPNWGATLFYFAKKKYPTKSGSNVKV